MRSTGGNEQGTGTTPALKQMLRQLCGEQHRAQDGSWDQSGVQGGGAWGQLGMPAQAWAGMSGLLTSRRNLSVCVNVKCLYMRCMCVCVCDVWHTCVMCVWCENSGDLVGCPMIIDC